jgi:hypothetical protein
MILRKVKSTISEALKSYQKRVGDLAKSLGNMRSMSRLENIKELLPLLNLMALMGDSLTSLGKKVTFRFLSGQHKGGWMGFSINNMDYFFVLYYENPEVVVFDTFSFKIDQQKYDGSVGKTWSEGKRLRWMNELNLVSNDFDYFSQSRETQLKVLIDFLKQSYSYVQKIKV